MLFMHTRLIGSVITESVISGSIPQPNNGHVPLIRSHVHHFEDAQRQSLDHRGIVALYAVMQGYAGLGDAWNGNTVAVVPCVNLTPCDLKGQSSSLGWVSV